jgi:hypothetical protein
LKRLTSGELDGVPGESARGDQDAAVRAFGRHNTEQLSDPLDWDLSIQPVLALDDHAFATACELEVGTAIGLPSSSFPHGIALLAVSLADEEFKIGPIHLPKRSRTSTSGKQEAPPLSLTNADQTGGQDGYCRPVGDCWKEGCKGRSHR